MQSGFPKPTKEQLERLCILIEKSKLGDNQALEELFKVLEPEINNLAQYIKMPREDTIQEIKTKFIEYLREQQGIRRGDGCQE